MVRQTTEFYGLKAVLVPRLLFAATAFCITCLPAAAANLEAAVIGNTNYPAAPLFNASRDAAVVAEALAEAGFTVQTYFDVPRDEMDAVLDEIGRRFADADLSVLYYAG
ncbi:MAG: caspase family protein, partial [Paracoccaceae bacterium]|nr:caspase family protein [Paracoccaceae bacterium]